eukprot:EG_transcript_8642
MEVIGLDSIPSWASTSPSGPAGEGDEDADDDPLRASLEEPAKFPCATDINDIVALWQGKVWQLQCDAIVNAAEEFYNDRRNPVSDAIFKAAGPNLELEVTQSAIESNPSNNPVGCRTGDAIITNAYLLPCCKVIHTVGPRFNEKYRTAAENMLHSCYRTCLQTLVENNMHTIAFSCIHSDRKNYLIRDAAPIVLRTIRRFLERYPGKIQRVVLVVQSTVEYSVYEEQMKLYFPRSKAEERQARSFLPEDTGNEIGETVTAERMIRISPTPGPGGEATTSLIQATLARDRARTALHCGASPAVPEGEIDTKAIARPALGEFGRVCVITGSSSLAAVDDGFRSMQGDPDARKKEVLGSAEQEAVLIYSRYLRKAQTENFSDIDAAKVIYKCGPDVASRPTIALVGSHLPSDKCWPRLLLYFIKILDSVVEKDYTVVYFHHGLRHRPDLGWLRRTYQILPEKYKKNLKALHIVHPSWLVNLCLAFMWPFVSERFWSKVTQVHDLRQLYAFVPPQSISVPDEVLRHNQQLFGDSVLGEGSAERRRPQDFL